MLSVYCNYQTAAFTAGPDYMSADLPLANQSDSVQCHYISIIHHMHIQLAATKFSIIVTKFTKRSNKRQQNHGKPLTTTASM